MKLRKNKPDTMQRTSLDKEKLAVIDKGNIYRYDSFTDSGELELDACCTKCWSMKKKAKIQFSSMINLFTDYIDTNDIYKMIGDMKFNVPWNIKMKCDTCKSITNHVFIDHGISRVVQIFNKMGIKTIYSCEGHATESPYIAFMEDISKIMDMSDPRLNGWIIEVNRRNFMAKSIGSILRYDVSSISIEEYYKRKYLKDLKSYMMDIYMRK